MKIKSQRQKRQYRIRKKVVGTSPKPRLAVFRSNSYIYAQIVDDGQGKTLAYASDQKMAKSKKTKIERAKETGMEIAKKALDKKIKTIVFDRGGFAYHGRIKALADGAREGGLKF